jgi:tripartite-type tricarboxylate transporter receptor subunit TctC
MQVIRWPGTQENRRIADTDQARLQAASGFAAKASPTKVGLLAACGCGKIQQPSEEAAMMPRRQTKPKIFLLISVAVLLAVFVVPVRAQDDYPKRLIRIIVPLPPGATADTLPRIIADKLSQKWGQPVVIENRAGAAQNLGAELVAKAEPDGYTLLATPPGPLVLNQNLFTKLAFDPTAFVPVTVMGALPNVLVAHPKVAFATVPEFVAYAKANPGKLVYGSAGTGSTPHLLMEWLMSATGTRMTHAPYRGSAPALTDVLAGHIDMMFDNIGNPLQHIKDGRVRALGIGSEQRLAALPDVPTLSESVPGFAATTWFAIVAPPKTPPQIAAKLSAAIAEILKSPDVAKRLDDMSTTPGGGTPAETAAFFQQERERWRRVIAATGIKME